MPDARWQLAGAALVTVALVTSLTGCFWSDDDKAAGTKPLVFQKARNGEERKPYMGVACSKPNSIACDRVALAVWLERRASGVTASIAGRELELRPPENFVSGHGGRGWWEGFVQPAGLVDGPLEVQPDRGRYYWEGRRPVVAPVRITARYRDGSSASRTVRVWLSPGYG
jgi:hypothetical protein